MNIGDILSSAKVSEANLDGKTVLVTGSTSGIGMYTAEAFAELGATVIIHGRNQEAGNEIVKRIEDNEGDAQFIKCYFSKINAVEGFASEVKESVDNLDILVNNAGGYFTHTQPNDSSINYTFMVNHLASFILTNELLPLLRSEHSLGRIVNTASSAHKSATYNSELFTTPNNNWKTYCHSKLLNLLFAKYLSRTEQSIQAIAIHPGAIPESGFARNLPSFVKPLGSILTRIPFIPVKTPQEGSIPILYGALHPSVESGLYITGTKSIEANSEVNDEQIQDRLYDFSQSIYERHK